MWWSQHDGLRITHAENARTQSSVFGLFLILLCFEAVFYDNLLAFSIRWRESGLYRLFWRYSIDERTEARPLMPLCTNFWGGLGVVEIRHPWFNSVNSFELALTTNRSYRSNLASPGPLVRPVSCNFFLLDEHKPLGSCYRVGIKTPFYTLKIPFPLIFSLLLSGFSVY
jgi:hypothetical protein